MGFRAYLTAIVDALYAIMVEEAPQVEAFMRANAVWEDNHDLQRTYLRAVAYRDDSRYEVGIIAFYDMEIYKQKNPKQDPRFEFGIVHETYTFPQAGIISIILPRRPNTVLGEEADRIWDRVRQVFAS